MSQPFDYLVASLKGCQKKHISCPNVSIFLDFGYDLCFMVSLIEFLNEENNI